MVFSKLHDKSAQNELKKNEWMNEWIELSRTELGAGHQHREGTSWD